MQVAGHTFLVTGGGSGLGRACVERFHAMGANVVIADVNENAGRELAERLGPRSLFAKVDVTDAASVQAALDNLANTFGNLHGVISCAGVLAAARVLGKDGPHSLELFRKVVDVNLVGTFNVFRLAAAQMEKNDPLDNGERGVLIGMSSIAADDGQIGQAAYSASKAGVSGLTLPLARELARCGIRVVSIAPGVFETPLMAAASSEIRGSLAAQIPFPPRFGRPDEFAALAQHIVENVYLNGTTIRLDGGLRMGEK